MSETICFSDKKTDPQDKTPGRVSAQGRVMGSALGEGISPRGPRDLNSDAHGLPSNSLEAKHRGHKEWSSNWQWPWVLSYTVSPEVNRKGESDIHLQLCLVSAGHKVTGSLG